MLRLVLHLLLVVCFLTTQAKVFADELRFPSEPVTARLAISTVDDRANGIIHYVACAREVDYYTARKAFRDGDETNKEDFLTLIAAKLHWVINHPDPAGCSYTLDLPIAERGAMDDTMGELNNDRTLPTRCAKIKWVSAIEGGVRYQIDLERDCMIAQVNEGIRAFSKDSAVGTSGLPCLVSSSLPFVGGEIEGEWDVPLRALIRILWMDYGHGILDAPTLDHMWNHQLSLYGGPFSGDYPVLQLCGDERAGEIFGTPAERLDRESWSKELLRSLWDIFRWFVEYTAKMAAIYALSTTGIGALPFAFAIGPAGDLAPALSFRIEETENHLLQIESSKYLINQMILRLEPDNKHFGELDNQQDDLRDWLLKKFKAIAEKDFDEYNSRPYNRYSLNAIQNLVAYADDRDLNTAARIVLTLSAAKFAAGSSDGRRIVPYRRLSGANIGEDLYTTHSGPGTGSDHELLRAFVYTGQTRLRGNALDGGEARHLIYAAIDAAKTRAFPEVGIPELPEGRFRWPIQVLETAVATKDRPPFAQHVGHDGIESYYATPAYTMTLGGIGTEPIQTLLGFTHKPEDTGAAVPSMIAPTVQGRDAPQVFRILGTGSEHHRSFNLCGYHGFICGINPRIPVGTYRACLTPADHGITFISSFVCFPESEQPHFYAAVMEGECDEFCDDPHRWGLIEVVWARNPIAGRDPDYEAFKVFRYSALLNALPDDSGKGTYVTREGPEVHYVLDQNGSYSTDSDGSSSIPGVMLFPPGAALVPFPTPGETTGDIIFREETVEGTRIHVSSPFPATPDIIIDFDDWYHPSITP